MSQTIRVPKSAIAPLLKRTFPDYKGRKFHICLRPYVILSDLHWSGGTRSVYHFVRCDGAALPIDVSHVHPWSHGAEGQRVDLPPHVVCVKHSNFCGHDTGITVYVNPEGIGLLDRPVRALLTAPTE